MRVIIVNEKGVRFHTGILKEEPIESYCSCARNKTSRDIELIGGNVFITVPDREYVGVVLRKAGSNSKDIHQRNTNGVSIYTTDKFMVMARFANSYQSALHYIKQKKDPSGGEEEDTYIISTQKIDKVQSSSNNNTANDPSKIFVYESSFGDVFSGSVQENYSGEDSNSLQQLRANLKRSSYMTLDDSYNVCWS